MTRDGIICGFHELLDDHVVWRRGHLDAWRYAWDTDPARKVTSTGRWKNTQEMKGMGS